MDSISNQMKQSTANGLSRFEARNNSQVFRARDLSRAYSEYYALKSFRNRLTFPDITTSLRPILVLLYQIYGFWCLDKHLATFYHGRFDTGAAQDSMVEIVRSELLRRCGELKDSSVAVVDALAPPDFALNSMIAKSDGLVGQRIHKIHVFDILISFVLFQLYKNIQNEFMTNPGAMDRASWWSEVRLPIAKSKL